jgi:DNA repair exonuclease SbcCD nuclease subunit
VDSNDFELALSDDAALYAAPCRSQAGAEDLALRLPSRDPGDGRIRIGMVHGQTFDIPGHQTNFPIARDAAVKRGLNYLALGDTHAYREIETGTLAPTVYPGAPEATDFGEKDAGFVAVVFFSRSGHRAILQKEPVARWTWRHERCGSLDEFEALAREDLRSTVLRLTFDMRLALPQLDRAEALIRELRGTEAAHGKAGVLDVDRSGLRLDASNLAGFAAELPDVLQSTLERLEALREGDQAEVAERAIYHLYRSFQGEAR